MKAAAILTPWFAFVNQPVRQCNGWFFVKIRTVCYSPAILPAASVGQNSPTTWQTDGAS